MKLSKQELINKINEKVTDEDLAIELIEDVSDSLEVEDTSEKDALAEEIEKVKAELVELKKKYKERFLSGEDAEEKIEEVKAEDPEEIDEKEVIDVKEI